MSTVAVRDAVQPPRLIVGPEESRGHRVLWALAVVTVLAALLRFVRIGHQSFWYDESFTVALVHHSPGTMLKIIPQTELTPPLYYFLAWLWARLFGYGEAALRSLSALAGVATVPAIYAAARQLISRRAGLTAAAIAAFNPLLVWYSQEARSYALLVLLSTLSLLAFAHARRAGPSRRALLVWALAASATIATHYFGVLAVAPEAVWLLWVHRFNRWVVLAMAAVAAVGGSLLPLALSQRPQASWIGPWRLDLRLDQLVSQYLLGTGAPARLPLELAGAAAVLLAVVLLVRRASPAERRGARVAAVFALSGLAISLLLLLIGVDELITRNTIVVLISVILLVSAGLGARRAGLLGLAGAGVLCVVGAVAAIGVAADPSLERPDWRGLARVVGVGRPLGAGRAILFQRQVFRMPLAVDMLGLQRLGPGAARINELDVVAMRVPPGGWFCWWGSECNLLGSKLDTAIHVRGLRRSGPILHVGQFSILRLRSRAPIRLTPGMIARALARAPLTLEQPEPPNLPRGFGPPYSYGLFIQRPR